MIRRQFLTALSFTLATGALAATHSSAEEAKKKGGGVGFTQFPMLTVFTQVSSNRHGTMSVDMGLYASDAKLSSQVKLYQPRLQDAYISKLQAYAADLNARSMVNTDYISGQLQQVTDQILGRTGAKVLLGSVLMN